MEKQENLGIYSEIARRSYLANMMGMSFSGERDLYSALGYPKTLAYKDYWMQFKRHDMAKAIINRPIKATWQGDITLVESDDDQETAFEKGWKQLLEEINIKDLFIRADRLTCLGRYGVILLGLDDVRIKDDALNPVTPGKRKLEYVKPLSEDSAKIVTWDTKPSSPRYGLPVTYELTISDPADGSVSMVLKVHYTRIIHIVQDKLESEIYGTPVLEAVHNRLTDLEKLVGGSAEMFWKGARPGYQAKVDDDYSLDNKAKDDIKDQVHEYEHFLRRIFTLQGVDIQALSSQVADPLNHVEIQLMMISSVTGIPKRILVGSERGELASNQDEKQWKELIHARRMEFAETEIIHPFVNRLIELQILPEYTDAYFVGWSDLFAMSDKEKAEIGEIRTKSLKEYASQPGAEFIIPPTAFMQLFLGLDDDQIELIQEQQEQQIRDEELDRDDETELPDQDDEQDDE